jgi:hypothetical protein
MADEFEGYVINDITYCVDPATDTFFPVRVIKVGRKFADVESINSELTKTVSAVFDTNPKNRRFQRPKLPSHARFGGCDERIVNTERETGQELRLLPFHFGTCTGGKIKELHHEDPTTWPLPTGVVYERWFKEADA